MVSESAKKRLAAKKAAKDGKLQGSAKPSPAVSQSPVSFLLKWINIFLVMCGYTHILSDGKSKEGMRSSIFSCSFVGHDCYH